MMSRTGHAHVNELLHLVQSHEQLVMMVIQQQKMILKMGIVYVLE